MARQFKILVIIGFFVMAICGADRWVLAANPAGDGKLSLYRFHTDDAVEVVIHSNGNYNEEELAIVDKIMRCRGNNSVHKIDRRLIDLIDHIQDHFGADTVEIISGYRSPEFNKDLKESGRGVASESLHMKGMAADIHIDEVSEEAVWKYVKSLGAGGAGFYPCYDFVHVDVGRRAVWAEADCAQRKLVGLDNNPNPEWKITTNKNNYRLGDVITFTSNKQALSKKAHLEKFCRGVWNKQMDIDFVSGKFEAKDLPCGKYRIVHQINPPAYSNEFYIKKK
jgi:uncharacterized protein YcbK (DUF882 family)